MNQKHRTRLTAVLLTGLVLGACRSSERDKSSDQPQSFARAFEVYETRRGSDDTEQPDWTLVDYDSDILVRPDRVLIAEAITTDPAPAPGVTADAVSLRVAAIEEQLAEIDGLDRTLRLIAEYERESADFFTNDFDEGRILSDDASWKKVLDKELQVIEHLATVAEVFVSQTEYDGRRPDRDALQFGPDDVVPEDVETDVLAYQDAVSAVYDRMAPPTNAGAVDEFGLDVPAERDTFDPAEVTRVVNETTALLRDRITELEVAVLKRAPKADVEMEAALLRGSERLPVSIAPYFLVEGVGRGDKPARIGIPSKADIARVQKGYEAYGELSDSINELAKIAGDKEKRKEFRDAALDALETFAKDLAEGLEADLEKVVNDPSGTIGTIGTIKSDASAVLAELKSLRDGVKALRREAPDVDPITLANNALLLMAQLRSETGLKALLGALVASLEDLPANLDADLQTLLTAARTTTERELEELQQALASHPATGGAGRLFSSLKQLAAISKMQSFGDLKPGKITRRPLSLDKAQDGLVQLKQTPAQRGDQLEITYTVKTKSKSPEAAPDAEDPVEPQDPEESEDEREYRASTLLDVRTFGFYTTLKSQILFYNRLNDGSSTFSAAPGISYNLHYLPESNQECWDAIAPGFGLSVSAPNFENGTELALGAQLTFINDMIQTGMAYNLSVDDDHWMYYVGFDLIGVFQAID